MPTSWNPRPAAGTSWRTGAPTRLDRILAVLNHPVGITLLYVTLFIVVGLATDWSFAVLLMGSVALGQLIGRLLLGHGGGRRSTRPE